MADTIIDNPIINSPFQEPARHFLFDDQGITDKIVNARRISEHLVPIPKPKSKSAQSSFFDEFNQTEERKPNEFINRLRNEVRIWRLGGYAQISNTSRRLLEYWTNPKRERRLYFCQIEAIETAIYLTEVLPSNDPGHIIQRLHQGNEEANQDLFRIAFKMATGSGKTLVMAMLIAWQTLNKIANPQDERFSDTFLIVTPGITIRDRLRVLMPNDPENYYLFHDLVPNQMMGQLQRANIVITNFHAFSRKETVKAGKLTKEILAQEGDSEGFLETKDQMVRRVCRSLGNQKNIIVINDEAHHCYRHRAIDAEEKLKGDERKEAEKREEQARIWITGLEAVKAKMGIKVVYDLSATPFFLKGSGYPEGTLFGWVVSDFSLTDAIESGIVKVPRVPVADDTMDSRTPKYRAIWPLIRDQLPKKGRAAEAVEEEPRLPQLLEGALQTLYSNYKTLYDFWQADDQANMKGNNPPVFIVVCNNTNVSRLVYNYIAGWTKVLDDGSQRHIPGKLGLFSNVEDDRILARPRTILVDSEQLESGESLSDEFKQIAADEIENFKADFRLRSGGKDPDSLTDADILREVMNTVGKHDKLGEQVRCVVSVSMLTEGWDASTVTHILGVRAFGTQLLCEQVIGRGLRRMSHVTALQEITCEDKTVQIETYLPEYAEVYGVPFQFIPTAAALTAPPRPISTTRVRALEERSALEITFPRVIGYRYLLPEESIKANFTEDSKKILSTQNVPVNVEMASIIGEGIIHTPQDVLNRRVQEVDFLIASRLLDRYFKDENNQSKPWYFPELLQLSRQWRKKCLILKDNTFPQLLLYTDNADDAVEKIYQAILDAEIGEKRLLPILAPYDELGSSRYISFDTSQPVYPTRADKCHVSHVVADTGIWEQKVAQSLENMEEVHSYVKNERLGFTIPYTIKAENHEYNPDYIVRINDGHEDLLNLVLEVSGRDKPEKQAKTATARTMWVPAVNAVGTYGRWAFHETTDPWNVMSEIRDFLE